MTKLLKSIEPGKYISPKEALKQIAKLPDAPEIPEAPEISLDRLIKLEAVPTENGICRSQEEWMGYWRNIDDNKIFASMHNLYSSFSRLKKYVDRETDANKIILAEKFMSGLQDDFNATKTGYGLYSSTRIKYEATKNTNAVIIHNCNSWSGEHRMDWVNVPVYRGVDIINVISSKDGFEYLKALFDTNDGPETIVKTLEFISGKNATSILIWTPDKKTRKESQEMATSFCYVGGTDFFVNADCPIEGETSCGRSRGKFYANPI
jgi:hypothetical protein